MKNIEVEVRGKIQGESVDSLILKIENVGKLKETKNRILIDYSTFLPGEGIKERTRDIRLRVTNGIPEIIVKIGKWGGSENRKEISLPTNKGDFDKLVQIFGIIGLQKGVLCVRNSNVYTYKNLEIAVVEVPGHSYYFEIEKMISENDNAETAKEEIMMICKELELEPFTDDQFYKYIETLNKDVNEVFDFSNYTENYFKERFNL